MAKPVNRLGELRKLRLGLKKMMGEADPKAYASLAKQYRETLAEIAELEGAAGQNDDEIGNLLQLREADGKPGAVRKSRA